MIVNARVLATNNLIHSKIIPKRKYRSENPSLSTAIVSNPNSVPPAPKMPRILSKESKKSVSIPAGVITNIRQGIDKEKLLASYEARFGQGTITKQQGERIYNYKTSHPSNATLVRNCSMRPSITKRYRVRDLQVKNVLPMVCIKGYLSENDSRAMMMVSKLYLKMIPDIIRIKDVDYTPLLDPVFGYQDKKVIEDDRADMWTKCIVDHGQDTGMALRFVMGEYTLEGHGPTFTEYAQHLCPVDMEDMQRITDDGCPAVMDYWEESDNKMALLKRGNQKSFDENPAVALSTMVKEVKHSHLAACADWLIETSPYMRHTSQGMVVRMGKNPRVVWDASTKRSPFETVLNEITSTEFEAAITFGSVKMRLYIAIYNWRVSFPRSTIWLGALDVKACFRFARIHVDLAGAFSFRALGWSFLTTSMVFGSNTSATSWEPFRRSIENLSVALHDREDLVEKHQHYLDMINWATVDEGRNLVKAKGCSQNPGVFGQDRSVRPPRADMYVDDALLACVGTDRMKKALASTIEAIFIVMGEPKTKIRQCPLAMDKWEGMTIAPQEIMLGLKLNTDNLTVEITREYQDEILTILTEKWQPSKNTFKIRDMHELIGKVARLGEGAPWIYKLISHLYTSLAFALSQNKMLLEKCSKEFKQIIKQIRTKDFRGSPGSVAKQIRFAMKTAAQMTHRCHFTYLINASMRDEIEFIRQALHPDSEIKFCTPLAHIIPRDPMGKMFGDSSLTACGGYSLQLKFVWHQFFPEEILLRTLLHMKENDDGTFVSINCLEYVTVIINYCAALTVLSTEKVTDDPHPVILSITDNTSALNWTLHTSKKSLIGRALARFFCGLMIDSPLGVTSIWISTHKNEVSDRISRLKKSKLPTSPFFSIDYKNLQQNYPELKTCRFFAPSPELLSSLWNILLTKKCPSLEQIKTLRQQGLGKVST